MIEWNQDTNLPEYGIGIDIGAGSLKAGIFQQNGEVLFKTYSPTHLEMGNREFEASIRAALDPLLENIAKQNLKIPSCIGIGSPGPIDSEKGILYASANLPKLDAFSIKDFLQKEYGLDSVLNNDANSAAIGEYYFGKGKGSKNLFVFTLGTGLGGGWVWEGRLYNGFRGNGMEVGHITVVKDGDICGCGKAGCAEAYFSARGILSRFRKRSSANLQEVSEVFRYAALGNETAKAVIQEGTEVLAEAGRSIVNLLNVDTIVFVGGLTRSWDLFGSYLESEIRKRVFPILEKNLSIYQNENQAILGAGALVFEKLSRETK